MPTFGTAALTFAATFLASDTINGALGTDLWSDASLLKARGYIELTERLPGARRRYFGRDPDGFFSIVTVQATPISNRVSEIKGSKYYEGQLSFDRCLEEYRLIKTAIETKYPNLKPVPIYQNFKQDEVVSSGLATSLGNGMLGSMGPQGRFITLACAKQIDHGVALIVEYHVSSAEKKLEMEESKQDEAARLDAELRKRGLNPKKF